MNGHSDRAAESSDRTEGRSDRKRRATVAACFAVVVALADAIMYLYVIPWVDDQEWSMTHFGSVGFALSFIVAMFTFLACVAMIAFIFSRSSYPSDRWQ